jgi:carbon-monoxide dehydrogenase large subunit
MHARGGAPPPRRREDHVLLTTGGTYVADVVDPRLDGAVCVQFVRSDIAYGAIGDVDVRTAAAMPGVVGIYTAADLDIGPMPPVLPRFAPEFSAPLLASGQVRYVGEPVAVVVAETAAQAVDAAEHVELHIEPMDAVLDAPVSGTVISALGAGDEDTASLFDGCDVVVRAEFVHPRLAACPLETRAAASAWYEGRLHHWVSTQGPHSVKRVLTAVFALADDAVRVIAPDVGGGFGPKFANFPEDVVVAWVACRVRRPARWVETRRESMVALHHGRGQRHTVVLGGTRRGELRAYKLEIEQDAGAYASLGAYAPEATIRMATGVYTLPRARADARAVRTHTTPVSAYRGTGRPEATCAIERSIDLFARAVGLDPVDVRRANLVPRDRFPYRTPIGTVYDSGCYEGALQRALADAGYDDIRAEQRVRRTRGDGLHLGVGVCTYVESTAAGPPMEFATIGIDASGAVEVACGSSPHGQGHATTWTLLASSTLGVVPERVRVVLGDTDRVPAGLGTYASRSVQLAGSAISRASAQLVTRGVELTAEALEADAADIVFDRAAGSFCVAGAPAHALTWADLASRLPTGVLVEHAMFTGAMTFPFGAHIAVVEVDGETGLVRLLRHVAVDDAGTLVHPVLAEGQIHGGIAQGVGEALLEEMRYDSSGTPLTTNLAEYAVPSAAELPMFEATFTETPAPSNPLGAKGVGESGIIGAVAAIQNAVCDALAHLGVRHIDVPATPERVWRAIRDAGGSTI